MVCISQTTKSWMKRIAFLKWRWLMWSQNTPYRSKLEFIFFFGEIFNGVYLLNDLELSDKGCISKTA